MDALDDPKIVNDVSKLSSFGDIAGLRELIEKKKDDGSFDIKTFADEHGRNPAHLL